MGTVQASAYVTASLSNHNDERDVQDREAWEDFCANLTALASDDRYEGLGLEVEC